MEYHVSVTSRAECDLEDIYQTIHADSSPLAFAWFNGLEKRIYSLDHFPDRGAITRENRNLRQLLYGRKPHIYRIIYSVDHEAQKVTILHIRHGARQAFTTKDIQ